MCRCAERRVILSQAASAVARGDVGPVLPAVTAVAVTSVQDIAVAARRLAAHARLRR